MGRQTVLMVGTRKGLWVGTSDEARTEWSWSGPHFDMEEVYSCMVDTRDATPRLLAGAASMWLGPRVRHSDDLGRTWVEGSDGGVRFPEDIDASVERIWQLVPGNDDDVVYAGTEPGAPTVPETVRPGSVPPAIAHTRPPRATTPRPWRGVGRSGSRVQARVPGSYA